MESLHIHLPYYHTGKKKIFFLYGLPKTYVVLGMICLIISSHLFLQKEWAKEFITGKKEKKTVKKLTSRR